ncbi:MAG: ATP-binding cassette domain-containing protein [Rhodospirillaceae bacterium]|nr:MAG: ATP-binding cassette domain-containing protein [Rhodospirillaceae bacterium]
MASTSIPAIELEQVTIALGGRFILSDVSLAVGNGEFIGVLGPNGAGKTTLMRALLGLIKPSSGHITVLGEQAIRGNPAIGYMPQLRSLAAHLTLRGWDFVASGIDGHRWGLPVLNAARRQAVAEAIDLVGATHLAQRPLGDLSGGERQRLMLAQALLGRPRLLLLDEPLISLDPHHQRVVVELVREVQQRLGIAVLFSAHELNPLLAAMDRVLYLGNGHAALGTVDQVINGPVLSRLYGSSIDVVRINQRIFVMSGGHDVERDAHMHENGHGHDHDLGHGHDHAHGQDHNPDGRRHA